MPPSFPTEVRSCVVRKDHHGFGFILTGNSPVHVSHVEPNSPAFFSGIGAGDVVLRVDGKNALAATQKWLVSYLAKRGLSDIELEVQRLPPNQLAQLREEIESRMASKRRMRNVVSPTLSQNSNNTFLSNGSTTSSSLRKYGKGPLLVMDLMDMEERNAPRRTSLTSTNTNGRPTTHPTNPPVPIPMVNNGSSNIAFRAEEPHYPRYNLHDKAPPPLLSSFAVDLNTSIDMNGSPITPEDYSSPHHNKLGKTISDSVLKKNPELRHHKPHIHIPEPPQEIDEREFLVGNVQVATEPVDQELELELNEETNVVEKPPPPSYDAVMEETNYVPEEKGIDLNSSNISNSFDFVLPPPSADNTPRLEEEYSAQPAADSNVEVSTDVQVVPVQTPVSDSFKSLTIDRKISNSSFDASSFPPPPPSMFDQESSSNNTVEAPQPKLEPVLTPPPSSYPTFGESYSYPVYGSSTNTYPTFGSTSQDAYPTFGASEVDDLSALRVSSPATPTAPSPKVVTPEPESKKKATLRKSDSEKQGKAKATLRRESEKNAGDDLGEKYLRALNRKAGIYKLLGSQAQRKLTSAESKTLKTLQEEDSNDRQNIDAIGALKTINIIGRDKEKSSSNICGRYDIVTLIQGRPIYKKRSPISGAAPEIEGKFYVLFYHANNQSWAISSDVGSSDVVAFVVDGSIRPEKISTVWNIANGADYEEEPSLRISPYKNRVIFREQLTEEFDPPPVPTLNLFSGAVSFNNGSNESSDDYNDTETTDDFSPSSSTSPTMNLHTNTSNSAYKNPFDNEEESTDYDLDSSSLSTTTAGTLNFQRAKDSVKVKSTGPPQTTKSLSMHDTSFGESSDDMSVSTPTTMSPTSPSTPSSGPGIIAKDSVKLRNPIPPSSPTTLSDTSSDGGWSNDSRRSSTQSDRDSADAAFMLELMGPTNGVGGVWHMHENASTDAVPSRSGSLRSKDEVSRSRNQALNDIKAQMKANKKSSLKKN